MGKMNSSATLLAAVSLMAVTVGMAPADAADTTGGTSVQQKCPNGQSMYIKMTNASAKQIKGDCQQIKQDATHIKMDSSHIKMDATQVKGTNSQQGNATAPRDAQSGMATGR